MFNLEPIKARWAKITEGPWHCQVDVPPYLFRIFNKNHNRIAFIESICDADAIAQAPNDIATLVVEVEALRSALAELLDAVRSGSSEDINTIMVACEELLDAESRTN